MTFWQGRLNVAYNGARLSIEFSHKMKIQRREISVPLSHNRLDRFAPWYKIFRLQQLPLDNLLEEGLQISILQTNSVLQNSRGHSLSKIRLTNFDNNRMKNVFFFSRV